MTINLSQDAIWYADTVPTALCISTVVVFVTEVTLTCSFVVTFLRVKPAINPAEDKRTKVVAEELIVELQVKISACSSCSLNLYSG
jgi:hypothetical protein